MKVRDNFYLISVEVVDKSGKLLKRLEFCDSIETAADAATKYEHKLKKNEEIWFVPYSIGQTKTDPPEFGVTYYDFFLPPKNGRYTKTYFNDVKRMFRMDAPPTSYSKYWPVRRKPVEPKEKKTINLSDYIFIQRGYDVTRHSKKTYQPAADEKIVSYKRAACPYCFHNVKHCTCLSFPKVFLDIDENIQPAILILNRKGYFTEACCEGHSWREDQASIAFSAFYKFPKELPPFWNQAGRAFHLYYKSAAEGNETFEEVKTRKMKEFAAWADSLPVREESFFQKIGEKKV